MPEVGDERLVGGASPVRAVERQPEELAASRGARDAPAGERRLEVGAPIAGVTGQRALVEHACTPSTVAPVTAGSRPARTTSTSGSSGTSR